MGDGTTGLKTQHFHVPCHQSSVCSSQEVFSSMEPSQSHSLHPSSASTALCQLPWLSNLELVLPSVICLVICLNQHRFQRNEIHLCLSTPSLFTQACAALLGPARLAEQQQPWSKWEASPTRKKRASLCKDWFPVLGTTISHKQPSH